MADRFVSQETYKDDIATFRNDILRFQEEVWTEVAEVKLAVSNLEGDLRAEIHKVHTQTILWLIGIVASAVALLKLLP